MPYIDYNRYSLLNDENGYLEQVPFVEIPKSPSDRYEYWRDGSSRLDKLSLKYYGNPFYDFLILIANPKYLSEFDIPNREVIRIPFPLSKAISAYETIIKLTKQK